MFTPVHGPVSMALKVSLQKSNILRRTHFVKHAVIAAVSKVALAQDFQLGEKSGLSSGVFLSGVLAFR